MREIDLHKTVKQAFDSTEAATSLKETHRWSQFRTNESNEVWLDSLGPTGQVYSHSELFTALAIDFVKREGRGMTAKNKKTFVLAARIHDWGEATLKGLDSVGDVSAFAKTQEDEKKEVRMAKIVIGNLQVEDKIKKQLLFAYEQVVEGKNPELNKAFKALEKSEYVMTAMHVFKQSLALNMAGRHGLELELPLIARVLVLDLPKVLDVHAPNFPNSIGKFFKENSETIDAMFAYSRPWLNENKEWQGKLVDHTELAKKFEAKWAEFKANPNYKS